MSEWIQIAGAGATGPSGSGASPTALQITFAGSGAQQGVAFRATLAAAGGVLPYTFAISAGSLPSGLSLNTATGLISGTPDATGSFSFTGQVTDAAATATTVSCVIVVVPAPIPVAQISSVTASLTSKRILADLSTHGNIQITPTWSSGSGQQALSVLLFYRRVSGTAPAWYYQGVFQVTVGVSLNLDILIVDGVSVNAQVAVIAGAAPGDGTVALGAVPSGYVTQVGTFPIVLSASANNEIAATITNLTGAAPTGGLGNNYVGVNSAGNPYWGWIIEFDTPGQSAPDTEVYELWGAWVDSSGNLIAPGGVNNQFGWQRIATTDNDGTHFKYVAGINNGYNYPGQGIDGYFEWQIWAKNRNSTATTPPFAGDTNSVKELAFSGVDHYRLHIGQPTNTVQMATPNVQNSAVWDPSFKWFGLIRQTAGWSGGFIPSGYTGGNQARLQWGFANNTGANISIDNTDGFSDSVSLKFTGDGSSNPQAFQKLSVSMNTYYNFAYAVKSSGSSSSAHQLYVQISWYDDSGNLISSSPQVVYQGPITSWTYESYGTVLAPSTLSGAGLPVAWAQVNFSIISTEPVGEWWKIDDIYFQSVVNQTSNGQTTTLSPRALSAGNNAAGAISTSTSANSGFGLEQAIITASDGGTFSATAIAGQLLMEIFGTYSSVFQGIACQVNPSLGDPVLSITKGSDVIALTQFGFGAIGGTGGSSGMSYGPVSGIGVKGGILYGGLGWVNVSSLLHGWSNTGGSDAPAQYSIDPFGTVHLRGAIHGGTITDATILFSLPSGYYNPNYRVVVPIVVFNGTTDVYGSLLIDTSGQVGIFGVPSNNNLHLDCCFRVF